MLTLWAGMEYFQHRNLELEAIPLLDLAVTAAREQGDRALMAGFARQHYLRVMASLAAGEALAAAGAPLPPTEGPPSPKGGGCLSCAARAK